MTATEQFDHLVLVEISEDGIQGTISVAPNVLVDIIELASAGTEGFVRFVAPGRGRALSLPIHEADEAEPGAGDWYARNGVRVRLENATINADLTIQVQHGANVPILAEELKRRMELARAMGGVENVERQHKAGRLTVRKRIERLLDPGSFHETGALAGVAQYDGERLVGIRPANFVMGTGRIDGRRVVVHGPGQLGATAGPAPDAAGDDARAR